SLAEQNSYIASAATGLTLPAEKKFGEQKSAAASLIFLSPDSCTITVCEGKFHEVRRIFRALGNEVTRLERISIGALQLPEDLKEGEWRPLTSREMEDLFL
ncbi:MAG: rRNA pseudouridine synthase, partial [Treponema sp.]|nr:rRNA pseudouridine synthase [Treponema sp.]